jgi:hypothetical protein
MQIACVLVMYSAIAKVAASAPTAWRCSPYRASDDYAYAALGQVVRDLDKFVVKELRFIDAHDFGVGFDAGTNLCGGEDVGRFMLHLRVRDDVIDGKAARRFPA